MIKALVIGNPTIDVIEGNYEGPGGPVAYVSNTLNYLGYETIEIITSFGKDYSVDNFNSKENLNNIESTQTNKFRIFYKDNKRKMQAISYGRKIHLDSIKTNIRKKDIIFVAPVLDEFSISETEKLMQSNRDAFFVGIPQGWTRKTVNKKVVSDFSNINKFPFFDIIFFSEDDLSDAKISRKSLLNLADILVITQGSKGAEIYNGDSIINIPPFKVKAIDTVGAGDIFAAVFASKFYSSRNLHKAGKMASKISAESTKFIGLNSVNSKIFL